ncbi:MAG: SpoIID/LytB domain-containing protein, partial [Oscillospiraceae bacterium]
MKFNMLIIAMLCIVLFVVPIFKGVSFAEPPPSVGTSYSRDKPNPISTDTSVITPMLNPVDNQDFIDPKIDKSSVWNNSNRTNVSLTFKILNESTGKIDKVNYKDFVKGAICAEMPPDFQLEAMKSQGICALTYALYNQKMNGNSTSPASSEYDFSADPENWKVYVTKDIAQKRYGDKFEQYWTKISEAANAIDNIVMVYNSEPILAAYHSTSSGYTEDA